MKPERAECAIEQPTRFRDEQAATRSAGSLPFAWMLLGFRCATPQALCHRPLRGLSAWTGRLTKTVLHFAAIVMKTAIHSRIERETNRLRLR